MNRIEMLTFCMKMIEVAKQANLPEVEEAAENMAKVIVSEIKEEADLGDKFAASSSTNAWDLWEQYYMEGGV